jgi:hypothetical protein
MLEDAAPMTVPPAPDAALPDTSITAAAVQTMQVQLAFEQNVGQAGAQVDFLARGSGYTVGLIDGNAVIGLDNGASSHVVQLTIRDGNSGAVATGENLLEAKTNYLRGSEGQSYTDIANFGAVRYDDVYDGVDVRYYGSRQQLEYDFVVHAGADPGSIRLQFSGVQQLSIGDNGDLILTLDDAGSTVSFKAPVAYQDGPSGRETVASHYHLFSDGSIGFDVADYDTNRTLVIDPVLSYGTYLGSSGEDVARGVTVDGAGNVYVAGYARNGGVLDLLNLLGLAGGDDVMVAKLSPTLGSVVYTSYIGGAGDDQGNAVAVDGGGNAYVTGFTKSSDFPTASAFQSARSGGQDAFVLKLNAAGNGLVYATYLGGSGAADVGYGIAVDAAGSAYVTGAATSANFPTTPGAADTTYLGSGEAFVTKLTPGGAVAYSTFIGGSDLDIGRAIAVDASGNAVVVGETKSNDFPTVGAFQNVKVGGEEDAFVTKLDATGSSFSYSTYLGGSNWDGANSVALDATGKIYVAGETRSNDFDTTNGAFQNVLKGDDAFVAIIDPSASGAASLVYSSYIGGDGGHDIANAIAVDPAGRVYVAGETTSNNIPVTGDAFDSVRNGDDGFVVVLTPNGGGAADLAYGTYFGGGGEDHILGAAYRSGRLYVAGETKSNSGVATTGAADTSLNGGVDGFAAAFTFAVPPTVTLAGTPLAYTENGGPVTIAAGLTVADPDSTTLSSATIQITANYANGEDLLAFNNSNPWGITGTWDAATGTLALTGASSLANYQAALRSVTYQNTSERPATGARTVTVKVRDAVFESVPVSWQIGVTSVNDAPVNVVPGAQAGSEDTPLIFSSSNGNAFVVADVDAGSSPVQITLTAANGRLTLSRTTGLTFVTGDGAGDATMTFTATVTDANAALDGLRFDPTPDFNGAASIQLVTNDQGNSGTGGPQTANTTVPVTIAATNDAPVNSLPGAQGTGQNTPLVFSTANGNGIRVTDIDAGSGSLLVTLTATGGTVTLGNTAGLDSIAGDGTGVVTLSGTLTALNSALDGLTFTTAFNFNGAATLQITTDDQGQSGSGSALVDSDPLLITVSPNIAPVVTTTAGGATYAENGPDVLVDAGVTVTDADQPALDHVVVRITGNYVDGEDQLVFVDQLGITGTWDPATGTLTLRGSATTADYQTALRSVTYRNSSDNPSPAARTVSFVANDGIADGAIATRTIAVAAVNDAPVNTVPGPQSTGEDTALVFSTETGNQIRISDIDAGTNPVEATLSVTSGVLTLSQTDGLTFNAGGNGTGTMTVAGTASDLNAALNGLRFDPSADDDGAVSLQLVTNDLGQSGGGALSDIDTVVITVTPINDAPVLTPGTPTLAAITEDQTSNAGQTVASFAGSSIADLDAGAINGIAITSVTGGNGAWEYSLDGGATWAGIGSVSDSAARLLRSSDLVRFVPDGNDGAAASLGYRAWDQSSGTPGDLADATTNGGTSAFSSGVDVASLTVTAVNDAPTAAIVPASFDATEQTVLDLAGTGVSIADVDAGASTVTATLSVVSGTLTVTSGTTGVAISGAGTNVVTLTGTVDQVNNLLTGNLGATASYILNDDAPPATDSLTLSVNDGGNAGSGGALSASITRTISIAAVNDAPMATIVPASYAATEQTMLDLAGTGLSIADVDAGTGSVTATISVVSGTLTVTSGTTGVSISGSGTNVVTLSGTVAQVNNLLAGNLGATATYVINADVPPATDSLTLSVDDGGNAGSGGALTASLTRTIAIAAANDAPTVTIVAASYAATEQTALDLAGTGLSIADVDAGGSSVTATLSVVSGTLTVGAGTTGVSVSGSGTSVITLSGTVTQINDLLAGNSGATVGYIINADVPPVTDSLTVSVSDGGNTGSGGTLSASVTRTITITAVNDAPLVTMSPASAITTDQPTALQGVSFTDPDADAGIMTATVTVDRGALSGVSAAGVTVSGAGNTLTLSGTLADLNSYIAAGLLGFVTAPGDSTAVTLAVSVNDGGATGIGGSLTSATATETLTVLPVPVVSPPSSVLDDIDPRVLDELAQNEHLEPSPAPASSPAIPAPVVTSALDEPVNTAGPAAQANAPSSVVSAVAGGPTSETGPLILPTTDREIADSAGRELTAPAAQGIAAAASTPRWARGGSSGASSDRYSSEQRLLDLLRIAFDQSKPAGAGPAAVQQNASSTQNREEFINGLNQLRDSLQNDARTERTAVTSMVAVGTGLSVGFVAWLIRGGALLSSLVSSLPAWRVLDPFPVLARRNDDDPLDDDDESLESLVDADRDETSPPDRTSTREESPANPEVAAGDRRP